jgi:hypothetical protein
MKRWRKQTRVNGIDIQTLRLRNFEGSSERGVMILLTLIHLKDQPRLTIEVDGDCLVERDVDELELLLRAQSLLNDAVKLLFPDTVPQQHELRKQRTEFPS